MAEPVPNMPHDLTAIECVTDKWLLSLSSVIFLLLVFPFCSAMEFVEEIYTSLSVTEMYTTRRVGLGQV